MKSMLAALYSKPAPSRLKVSIQVIEALLNNNVAVKNAPLLFADAFKIFASMEGVEEDKLRDAVDSLVTRPWTIANMQHLEVALDQYTKELIFKDVHCLCSFLQLCVCFV